MTNASHESGSGSLQSKLWDAVCHNTLGGWYLPCNELIRIVNKSAVKDELRQCEKSFTKSLKRRIKTLSLQGEPDELETEIDEIARRVCGCSTADTNLRSTKRQAEANNPKGQRLQQEEDMGFRKIMAILILIGRPHKIRSLLKKNKEGFCDTHLPVTTLLTPQNPFRSFELSRENDPDTPLSCFRKWNKVAMADFKHAQWIVLAPHFRPGDCEKYHANAILPFTSCIKHAEGGGTSWVYKVEIHPYHHSFNDDGGASDCGPDSPTGADSPREARMQLFAIKQLSEQHSHYKKEVGILKKINKLPHPHLIDLLASYEYRGEGYLIFHWAKFDLLTFWKSTSTGPNKRTMERWLAKQCQGIAEGLATIHRRKTYTLGPAAPKEGAQARRRSLLTGQGSGPEQLTLFCRHGDIKPSNILWFPTENGLEGILKIADFGSAEISTEEQDSTPPRSYTSNYQPPEAWRGLGGILRPAYDIWSLGCLYLEFAAWWFGGWEEIYRFLRDRPDNALSPHGFDLARFFSVIEERPRVIKAVVKPSVSNAGHRYYGLFSYSYSSSLS